MVTSCAHTKTNPPHELPDRFELIAVKMESAVDSSFRTSMVPVRGNNPRVVLYSKIKGISDSMRNITEYFFPFDYIQAVFQA